MLDPMPHACAPLIRIPAPVLLGRAGSHAGRRPQGPRHFLGLYDRAASERRTSVDLLYGGAPVEEVSYAAGESLDVVASTIDLVDQNEMLLREQQRRRNQR